MAKKEARHRAPRTRYHRKYPLMRRATVACPQRHERRFRKGQRKKTVGEVRGALSRMFDAAVEAELIPANPVSSIKLGKRRARRNATARF